MEKIKLLFLDIDGVMNTEHGLKTLSENWTKMENIHRKSKNGLGYENYPFCPECIEVLRKIIEITGVKIVITSTWGGGVYGYERMKKLWEERNLPGEIYGVTKHRKDGVRGKEVDSYLKGKGYYYPVEYWNAPVWEEGREKCEIDGYCIVDDEWDFFIRQEPHFVNTPAYYGLSGDGIMEKIIECLKITP